MKVIFKNNHRTIVSVAVMFFDPDSCGDHGNWTTRGWWNIVPGQERWAFSTTNRFAAFFALSQDGLVWTGNVGPANIPLKKFDSCIGLGATNTFPVGMRLLTLPWFRFNPFARFNVNINS